MFTYLFNEYNDLEGPFDFPVIPGIGIQPPSNSITLSKPLKKAANGKGWKLINGTPVQVTDKRGIIYNTVDNSEMYYNALGEIPEGYTSRKRTSEFHSWSGKGWKFDNKLFLHAIAVVSKKKRERIEECRELKEQEGFKWSFDDIEDIIQLRNDTDKLAINTQVTNALIMQNRGIDYPIIDFKAASNTVYTLRPSQMIELGNAVIEYTNSLMKIQWELKQAIEDLALSFDVKLEDIAALPEWID